ncbi:MAG: hypothetical protein R3C97_16440 [Geminicoccaceae bacterium]
MVSLRAQAHIPRDHVEKLDYLGANVGDHFEAAAANLAADDGKPPFFERAVYRGACRHRRSRLSRRRRRDWVDRYAPSAERGWRSQLGSE